MNERRIRDEAQLIDYCTGNCEPTEAQAVHKRLAEDDEFHRLHDAIHAAGEAIRLYPDPEAPEDIVTSTLARLRQHRQTDALLAREQIGRPRVFSPTFSLKELGAVAVAVVLTFVAFVPSMSQLRQQSQRVQCASNAGQIGAAIGSYAMSNNSFLPASDSTSQRWLFKSSEPAASNSSGLFKLVKDNYVSPGAFQCPAVRGPAASGFVVQAGMSDFPADQFISYSYQHTLGPDRAIKLDQLMDAVADKMAIFADATPIFRNGKFLPDRINATASDNHARSGQNVLYLDGHVAWQSSARVGVQNDHIYLADGVTEYSGDETPASPTDSFLLPAYTSNPR